ncbi:MAG: type III pantothenate kinase [Methylococcales bacterium]
MNLLVDVGNTRIKWASQLDQRLIFADAVVHRDHQDLSALIDRSWLNLEPPSRIMVSNVAGQRIEQALIDWIRGAWGAVPEFVGVESGFLSFKSEYCIETLGIDRWMALLALRDQFELPAIVVSCGTAVTADVLTDKGLHIGGVIMPGLTMMREVLHQRTNGLSVASTEPIALIGRDTGQAMASGTRLAICGMIDRVILEAEHQGHLNPKLVLTGGDAQVVANALGRPVLIEPHLVLMGLMLVAEGL